MSHVNREIREKDILDEEEKRSAVRWMREVGEMREKSRRREREKMDERGMKVKKRMNANK